MKNLIFVPAILFFLTAQAQTDPVPQSSIQSNEYRFLQEILSGEQLDEGRKVGTTTIYEGINMKIKRGTGNFFEVTKIEYIVDKKDYSTNSYLVFYLKSGYTQKLSLKIYQGWREAVIILNNDNCLQSITGFVPITNTDTQIIKIEIKYMKK